MLRLVFSSRSPGHLVRPGSALLACALAASAGGACLSEAGTGPRKGDIGQGGAPGATALEGLVALHIDPPSAVVEMPYGKSAEAAFKAVGSFEDGTERDVTASVAWSTDAPLGTADGGTVRSARPGKVTVTAASGSISARAELTIKLTGEVTLPGAPADAAAALDGAPAAESAPAIAYPLDGALFPSNLGAFELQIAQAAPAQSVGRIEIQGDLVDLRIVGACAPIAGAGGCAMTLPEELSPLLAAASEADAMKTRVRLAAPDGAALGESAAIDVRWASAPLSGGLYYWRTTGFTSTAIYRYDLDRASSPPELFWSNEQSPPLASGQQTPCMGCHALAQGGDKIALTFGGSGPSSFALVDVATLRPIAVRNTEPDGFATMTTFSPDGSRMVNAFRGALTLRKADESLEAIGDLFPARDEELTQPFWAPDGQHLAFVGWKPGENGAGDELYGDTLRGAQIYIADASGESIGDSPKILVPREAGKAHYYPAISDDSAWVVFNTSSCDGPPGTGPYGNDPCDSYDDNSARLQIVPVAGGAPVDLARANGATPWANSWPRFSPTHDVFRGKSIYWVAFSSRRPYGLRLSGSSDGSSKPQLWFAAVTLAPGAPIAGDPSFAPIWMPQQDDDMAHPTGNHIPQWASKALPVPR